MASHYQSCDNYFMMTDDRCERGLRNSAQEYETHVKNQRQLLMAEQLSQLAKREYGEDIVRTLEEQELQTLPEVASIDIQTEIQWFMRPYLLDFLIEAHSAFGLLPETLFLTVNILDRYCSKRVVYRRHYQLVGCTALLVAAKYGECPKKVPHIRELAKMCCSLYDEDMFIQMERHVMMTLEWVIGAPTVAAFLDVALDNACYDPEVEHMARYVAEIALFHKEFVSNLPSDLAKAALALSRVVLNRPQPRQGEWAANYKPDTLFALSQHLQQPSSVLLHKYKSAHLSRVAMIVDDFIHHQLSVSAVPPTLPSDIPSPVADRDAAGHPAVFKTPQKPSYPANMPHGCLTPPITPESECFAGHPSSFPAQNIPGTPTPAGHYQSTRRYASYYGQAAVI